MRTVASLSPHICSNTYIHTYMGEMSLRKGTENRNTVGKILAQGISTEDSLILFFFSSPGRTSYAIFTPL